MEDLHVMLKAMNAISARERLVDFNVSDYPSLKKQSREKLHREFYKAAFPLMEDATKNIGTTEDLMKLLSRG